MSIDSGVSPAVALDVSPGSPVISPDGQKVAFLQSTGDPFGRYTLFVASTGGGDPLQLTKEGTIRVPYRPVWSDDSQRVYVSQYQDRDLSIKADGSDKHVLKSGEAAFCLSASAGLARVAEGIVHWSYPSVVGLDRGSHAGIDTLAGATAELIEIPPPNDPDCVVSGDSRFALLVRDGALRVFDLTTGVVATIVSTGVRSAAWVGSCASGVCQAARHIPGPTATSTPYAGELPAGVTPVPPIEVTARGGEMRFYSTPSTDSLVLTLARSNAMTVIGRIEADGRLWYYLSEDSPAVHVDGRYVRCSDVEPCEEPLGLPVSALIVVQEGDTLSSIAARYDVTVEDILAVNPEVDPDDLQPGDYLRIPAAPDY